MATYVPAKRATELIFYVALTSQANVKILQVNPTLASGDVKVEIDGGSANNLTTLPAVTPAGGTSVKVTVSIAEMTGDNITVRFHDAAGDEWCDLTITISTVARQVDDLTFPVVSGRGLDVTATGAAGIDWANVENPTTTLALTGTTVKDASDITTFLAAVIPDSVSTDGTRPTLRQALLMITRFLMEREISGVTMTVNKEDGTTGAMSFTLNDAVNPTGLTRAS